MTRGGITLQCGAAKDLGEKARGERRCGISGGFAQDDSLGRREDNILPTVIKNVTAKEGEGFYQKAIKNKKADPNKICFSIAKP